MGREQMPEQWSSGRQGIIWILCHLGRQKTSEKKYEYRCDRICRTCPQCQKTASRCPHRAPLVPLQVIGVPFEQLGMDVIGPLERSKAGNRFMLLITEYATRYPEVFPLKTVKARTVAICLMQLFSRVGFPKTVLTDQGLNFMSKLVQKVYRLLGVKGLRTTPYHPQTDCLTERFNQTLKTNAAAWDQWIPYLLFAYREVPYSSTGFSPFELLYGQEV